MSFARMLTRHSVSRCDDAGMLSDIDDPEAYQSLAGERADEAGDHHRARCWCWPSGSRRRIMRSILSARGSPAHWSAGWGGAWKSGPVHFNLFTGPGFTVDDVTIHEDPRAGIEPFAYVGTLEARVQLLSLLPAPSGVFEPAAGRCQHQPGEDGRWSVEFSISAE